MLNAKAAFLNIFYFLLLLISSSPASAVVVNDSPVSKLFASDGELNNVFGASVPVLAFDQDWRSGEASPFVKKQGQYELRVNIGSAQRIQFPGTLDSSTPILIQTPHGEVKQYLVSSGRYQAELTGKYLIYRGEKNSILYRYDTDQKSLREFVYVEKYTDMPESGEVIEWRWGWS